LLAASHSFCPKPYALWWVIDSIFYKRYKVAYFIGTSVTSPSTTT
jgi:hypothetical protein